LTEHQYGVNPVASSVTGFISFAVARHVMPPVRELFSSLLNIVPELRITF
jgi:hypothetical protein